jgi:hypothetical protein
MPASAGIRRVADEPAIPSEAGEPEGEAHVKRREGPDAPPGALGPRGHRNLHVVCDPLSLARQSIARAFRVTGRAKGWTVEAIARTSASNA